MKKEKLKRSLTLIAEGVETGYSSIVTFAYKETLNANEQQELAKFLLQQAESLDQDE